MLIFGTADGKVTVYDESGSHYVSLFPNFFLYQTSLKLDINMVCLENMDLEQVLASKHKNPYTFDHYCFETFKKSNKKKKLYA